MALEDMGGGGGVHSCALARGMGARTVHDESGRLGLLALLGFKTNMG
jgi:hypothetical protein